LIRRSQLSLSSAYDVCRFSTPAREITLPTRSILCNSIQSVPGCLNAPSSSYNHDQENDRVSGSAGIHGPLERDPWIGKLIHWPEVYHHDKTWRERARALPMTAGSTRTTCKWYVLVVASHIMAKPCKPCKAMQSMQHAEQQADEPCRLTRLSSKHPHQSCQKIHPTSDHIAPADSRDSRCLILVIW